jgi:hypothetical protein
MPPARPSTKWDPDPNDPTIRRWRDNLRRGSIATGDAWFRALRRFCAKTEHTPNDLLKLKPRDLRDVFLDFVSSDEKRGAGGAYTAYTVKVARSWLKFNDVIPPSGVKVRSADTTFEETALSADQLRAVLGAAGPREKVGILLMATAGVRPEVLGNFLGTDGLVLGDLLELVVEKGSVSFPKTPTPVVVRRDLSKANHRYYTFLGEEGAGAVTDYLNGRLVAGERLDAVTPLYAPERTDLTDRRFVRTSKIGNQIRRALRAAGLANRPYALRTTAASRFAECENRGLVSHRFWQHWLGHSGDMSARYTVNRGKIPPTLLEEMRTAYRRCEPYLSTAPTKGEMEDRDLQTKRLLLLAVGYAENEIDKMKVSEMEGEDLVDAIRKSPARTGDGKAQAQQVISEDELPRYLSDGWRAVMPVNGSRFVVERSYGPVA